MAHVIHLARAFDRDWPFEAGRMIVIAGCALALIAAGNAFPF